METRSKRRRLISISSHVSSQWPNVPASFELLNDDTLGLILKFVGGKSYRSFGGVNKQCKEVYLNTKGMRKETYLFGYGPLSVIQERYERVGELDWYLNNALSVVVVSYNRFDILIWALEKQNNNLLGAICHAAGRNRRWDLLDEVLSNVDKNKEEFAILSSIDKYAAAQGKLNVLKRLEEKEIVIDDGDCAGEAARAGHIHIIQWLREERGMELDGSLYDDAAKGGQLYVLKRLREQEVPWKEYNFYEAAEEGNLEVLQWLHNERCPWPENYSVGEQYLKPEVVEWCRMNGYGDRVLRQNRPIV